jgi:hypothetical protein
VVGAVETGWGGGGWWRLARAASGSGGRSGARLGRETRVIRAVDVGGGCRPTGSFGGGAR